MSDCDHHENNNKPIGNGLIVTTVTATTAVMFFDLRLVGIITIYIVGMVYVFTGMGNVIENLYNKWVDLIKKKTLKILSKTD